MIDPATFFALGGALALVGWAALLAALVLPRLRPAAFAGAGLWLPALLGIAYVVLLASGRAGFEEGGFGSIAEVRALFANDAALAAGWLHYLAFDLFVGAWIARTGLECGVARLLIVPCLALTFLAGPAGLVLFLLVRFAARARSPQETAS
jgi:hypothetical protein